MEKLFEAIIQFDEPSGWWSDDRDYKGDDIDDKTYSDGRNNHTMPKIATDKSGRLRRVPAALKIMVDYPGSTTKEITEMMHEDYGYTSQNSELFPMMRHNYLFVSQKGGKHYITARGIQYLKDLGVLDKDADYPCVKNLVFDDETGSEKSQAVMKQNNKNSDSKIDFEDD